MRIGLIHSFYRASVPSGENTVVLEQMRTLQRAGHDVRLISRNSPETVGLPGALSMAIAVASHSGPAPTAHLRDWNPDVLHVHNLFPNFGYQWLEDCPFPVVATLHNFRSVCANGLLFRDGQTCRDCLRRGSWEAIRHRCYRDSVAASLPMAWRTRRGISGDELLERADRLIVLSELGGRLWKQMGIAQDRLRVVPNGLPDVAVTKDRPREGWLVVARLSAEKGVLELMREWPADSGAPLRVIGNGPLETQVRNAERRPLVQYLGPLAPSEVAAQMSRSVGVVIPSLCYENLPTVMVEAMRSGCAVVARGGTAAAHFVRQYGGGDVYTHADELAERVAAADLADQGARARTVYEQQLSSQRWLDRILSVYEEVSR